MYLSIHPSNLSNPSNINLGLMLVIHPTKPPVLCLGREPFLHLSPIENKKNLDLGALKIHQEPPGLNPMIGVGKSGAPVAAART